MGTRTWTTARGLWMQLRLPKLYAVIADAQFTSAATISYNCVGFAIGDPRWWQPSGVEGHVWPNDMTAGDYRVTQYLEVFRRHGFMECDDPAHEDDHEKLAVFGTGDEFEHVAVQISANTWISKLGDLEDIEHLNAECLEGKQYGAIAAFMKRPGRINRRDRFPGA